jgi:hypothetical protein
VSAALAALCCAEVGCPPADPDCVPRLSEAVGLDALLAAVRDAVADLLLLVGVPDGFLAPWLRGFEDSLSADLPFSALGCCVCF